MADAVVVQTQVARNDFPTALRSKTTVVGGFRPWSTDPRPTRQIRHDEKVRFACVVRGVPDHRSSGFDVKGLDLLLDSVDRISADPALRERIEVHVYGPCAAVLNERIKQMPGVFAWGYLPYSNFRAALDQNGVLIFPSRYVSEGHPGVVIEALMAGMPVIASDLPGPSEVIRHEENGLLVRTGDAAALAAAMVRLATDDELLRLLSKGARDSASDFTQERVLPRLVAALGVCVSAQA